MPAHFYDPHKAPLLDHYRQVPNFSISNRSLTFVQLESPSSSFSSGICQVQISFPFLFASQLNDSFLILFILFIIAIELNTLDNINVPEALFMIFALGFTLEKVAAMHEHGFNGWFIYFDVFFLLDIHFWLQSTSRVLGLASIILSFGCTAYGGHAEWI